MEHTAHRPDGDHDLRKIEMKWQIKRQIDRGGTRETERERDKDVQTEREKKGERERDKQRERETQRQ